MKVVQVAVVDEHDIFRSGLVACISADPTLTVVSEGRVGPIDGRAQVAVASWTASRSERFDCPVLVCGDEPKSTTSAAGQNRIMAILPRGTLTEEQLIASVRAAAAGLRVDVELVSPPAQTTLPERSMEILRLLAQGADTREISHSVGYAERTVKSAIQVIERQLGVRSRAHAVAEAIRRGLILAVLLSLVMPGHR